MDVEGRRIWQQAAGDTNRNYVDVCLDWDVILNGPGRAGPWPECAEALREMGASERKLTDLRRFSEQMEDGELVVLRTGTSQVHGVGEIVGDYSRNELFGDVDGWDLEHVRRVRWLWTARQSTGPAPGFATYTMKFGDTTQLLDSPDVLAWLRDLEIPPAAFGSPLQELPPRAEKPELEEFLAEVSEYLFDKGVASDSIENLKLGIGELRRIANWYTRSDGNRPSEAETIAYLIVPLFRAMGWTPQKMAVEWNRVDVALFESLPRVNDHLAVVVEAKKKGSSCLTAASQASAYAIDRGGCDRLVVTDGIRYGVFTRCADEYELRAYLNLTRLMRTYPIYRCAGAGEALLAMTPEWAIDDLPS